MDRTDEDRRVPLDIDEARAEQMLAMRLRAADIKHALEDVRERADARRVAEDRLARAVGAAIALGASDADVTNALDPTK